MPIETVRQIHVTPDPGVMRAIGLNHDFESAIADLVDNSIDANATNILIRFVLESGLAVQLIIIDDGDGMDQARIDDAMRLGKPKAESSVHLGHFGMGLKSASFSQASTLTVLSRRAHCAPEGRRMQRDNPTGDFAVDILDPEAVGQRLQQTLGLIGNSASGTAVQWDDCRTFPVAQDPAVTIAFIENKVAGLRSHLGLVFHRLLKSGVVNIAVDVYDTDERESGPPFTIEPIDPFGYSRTGRPGYPKRLLARLDTDIVQLDCHVWPGGADSHEFRLYGQPVDRYQGLYLYRNDRLLMIGGWGGVTHESKSYKLARVAVDIEKHLGIFTMSMEKASVHLTHELVHSIERATAKDGTKFRDYLDDASDTFKASNRRIRRRTPILPPGQGLHPRIKRTIKRETPILPGEEAIRIRWKRIVGDDFVELDRPGRTLWLNTRYRSAILHGDAGGVNDAPVVKSLLFLLYEDLFRGQAMGAKDKENHHFWNEVLTTAAQSEADEV